MNSPLPFFSFAYPWAFALPVILALLSWLRRPPAAAVAVSSTGPLASAPRSLRLMARGPILRFLTYVFFGSLTLMAARPQWITFLDANTRHRNLVLAIDISRSMGAVDFSSPTKRLSRMSAVKDVVSDFVRARSDDRIGVVVFASSAFVQVPLTLDHALILRMIDRLEIGMAGDGTAIGDGLGIALKRLSDAPRGSSSVILITDGVNNSGHIDPLTAAQIARDERIKVHTVTIGTDSDLINSSGGVIFGRTQAAEVDEESMKAIAAMTGGEHFNAKDLQGLKRVYSQIDRLEKTERSEPPQRLVAELFYPFLITALLSYALLITLSDSLLRRIP